MECAAIDLKAYALGEGVREERGAAEAHIRTCAACGEELARLQLTQAALGALREEEVPRRIAFVSDKVFEPSLWQRFWNSGPKLAFASAGMLSAAILLHGFAVRSGSSSTGLTEVAIQQQIDSAVTRAVAEVEARQENRFAAMMAAADDIQRRQASQTYKQVSGLRMD